MIKFKKFGKEIKIHNYDWKKLRERFDVKNARWDFVMEDYRVGKDCSLCDRYKTLFGSCGSCPFVVFDRENGCMDFFKKLFNPMRFKVGSMAVHWPKQANKLARKQLGQILKMMDKIEASQ